MMRLNGRLIIRRGAGGVGESQGELSDGLPVADSAAGLPSVLG